MYGKVSCRAVFDDYLVLYISWFCSLYTVFYYSDNPCSSEELLNWDFKVQMLIHDGVNVSVVKGTLKYKIGPQEPRLCIFEVAFL